MILMDKKKIKIDDVDYEIDQLSDNAKKNIASLNFVTKRLEELSNVRALLLRAKQSYIDGLKKEIISDKSGLLFGDD